MVKKLLSLVVAVTMMATLFAGFAVAEGEVTKLVWWKFNDEAAVTEANVARWNEQHPDRQIEVELLQYSLDEMTSKLQMALSTGVGVPDMVDVEISKLGLFMNGTEDEIPFVPLDQYVEANKDSLNMQRMAQYEYGGHYYGADINGGTSVTYYNVGMCEAAGIDYKSIKTSEDYVEAGRKFLAATGKPWTVVEANNMNSLYCFISQHGGDFFDADMNVTLNSETNIATFTWLQDMVKEGLAVVAPGGNCTSEEFCSVFPGDYCATVTMPAWFSLNMYFTMPSMAGKMAISLMPSWEGSDYTSVGVGGTAAMAYKYGENAELAAEFINEARFTREAALTIGTIMAGMDPIRLDVYDELAADETNATHSFMAGGDYYKVLKDAQANMFKQNYNIYYPYLEDVVTDTVCYRIFVDLEDVKTVLDEATAEIEATIADLV